MYAEHESWRFVLCEKDEDMLVTTSRRQGATVWSKEIGAILWPLVSRYPCKIDICRSHNWGKVAKQHSVSFEDVQGKEALYIYGRSTTPTRIIFWSYEDRMRKITSMLLFRPVDSNWGDGTPRVIFHSPPLYVDPFREILNWMLAIYLVYECNISFSLLTSSTLWYTAKYLLAIWRLEWNKRERKQIFTLFTRVRM